MSRILIVDDSPVDAKLIAGLLQNSGASFEIQSAADGEQAVSMISRDPPDLVVTDLVMPRLDGLGLVHWMARNAPLVPIVVTTSRGSEELAVEALEQGASSYLPKGRLGEDLVDVLARVLAAAEHSRLEHRVMQGLTRQSSTFDLPSDHSLFRPLIQHLQGQLDQIGFAQESVRMRIGLALEEALNNAHVHGNLEVDSALRESSFSDYLSQIESRMTQSPYRERHIHVESRLTSEEARFEITDDGSGFDPDSLPDPTEPENLERAAGRGLLLIRTFMDEIEFRPPGNSLIMKKHTTSGRTTEDASSTERELRP